MRAEAVTYTHCTGLTRIYTLLNKMESFIESLKCTFAQLVLESLNRLYFRDTSAFFYEHCYQFSKALFESCPGYTPKTTGTKSETLHRTSR